MSLLSLPTELLQRVSKETIPEDFENFALTCTTLYDASGIFMEQHNRLRRQFRNFKYKFATKVIQDGKPDVIQDETCESSMVLLAKIAANPLIARYIVSANLKEHLIPRGYNPQPSDEWKDFSGVLAMLEESPYLKDAGVDPKSMFTTMMKLYDGVSVILKYYTRLTTAFLLTLLPNATSLFLDSNHCRELDWDICTGDLRLPTLADPMMPYTNRDGFASDSKLATFLDAIVTRANSALYPTASLSKLTSIHLESDCYWHLSTCQPLLSINSVRNFYGRKCGIAEDVLHGLPFMTHIPPYPILALGLEVVELVGACVDDEELTRFLSWLPNIKTFKMNYTPHHDDSRYHWDAAATMTTIEKTVGDRLERLSFSMWDCYAGLTSAVTSLKNFQKLKYLELDLTVLRKSPNGQARHKALVDQDREAVLEIQRLGDLLPATVEKIRLLADEANDSDAMDRLFSNVAADKDTMFPNLKKITICTAGEERKFVYLNEEPVVGYVEGEPTVAESLRTDAGLGVSNENTEREKSSISNSVPRWREDVLALGPSVRVKQIFYLPGQTNSFAKDWNFEDLPEEENPYW